MMLNFSFLGLESLQLKKTVQISTIKPIFFIRLNISCEVTKKIFGLLKFQDLYVLNSNDLQFIINDFTLNNSIYFVFL